MAAPTPGSYRSSTPNPFKTPIPTKTPSPPKATPTPSRVPLPNVTRVATGAGGSGGGGGGTYAQQMANYANILKGTAKSAAQSQASSPRGANPYNWEAYAAHGMGGSYTGKGGTGYSYLGKNTAGTAGAGQGGGGRGYSYGYGAGAPAEPPPVTWSDFNAGIANAPAWWKAKAPSQINAETEYLASVNMLIPFLSPEDQRAAAALLYQQNPQTFAYLPAMTAGKVPTAEQIPGQRAYFEGAQRTQQALAALNALAKATAGGKSANDFGPGYRYLQTLLSTGGGYGGGPSGMTRAQQISYLGAMDPLLAQTASGSLAAYGPVAKMLATPFFSSGQLMPMTKSATGEYNFGSPIRELK